MVSLSACLHGVKLYEPCQNTRQEKNALFPYLIELPARYVSFLFFFSDKYSTTPNTCKNIMQVPRYQKLFSPPRPHAPALFPTPTNIPFMWLYHRRPSISEHAS